MTATVVDDGQETESPADTGPDMAAADYWMQARTRANVRSGPGTDYSKVGLLEAGDEVHVTGEGGDWMRIQGPDGSIAYVHRSLLVPPETTSPEPDGTAALSPKCAGMSEGSACWNELANEPGCYCLRAPTTAPIRIPSPGPGPCSGGLAAGNGTLQLHRGQYPSKEREPWSTARQTAIGLERWFRRLRQTKVPTCGRHAKRPLGFALLERHRRRRSLSWTT